MTDQEKPLILWRMKRPDKRKKQTTDMAVRGIRMDEEDLAKFCLDYCGGGWTTDSTNRAMRMQRRLTNGSPVPAFVASMYYRLERVGEAEETA